MGLLSGLSKMVFGDPGKGIRKAGDKDIAFKQKGVDYLQQIQRQPLETRDKFNNMLSGFYGGDAEIQNKLIDSVKSGPLYSGYVKAGQEGILDKAQMMGMSRSGNVADDLAENNQNILAGLLSQQLGGARDMLNTSVNQLNPTAIASMYSGMGDTEGRIGMGIANAEQAQMGQLLNFASNFVGPSGG